MSILAARLTHIPGILRGAALALVLAATMSGVATRPALADDGWHRGHERHEWRERAWREHEWRLHHGYAYRAPAYVYAPYGPAYAYVPPPVVYAPPPVVYAPPPTASLNFVFPLGHR
jgi:hypothetical protein